MPVGEIIAIGTELLLGEIQDTNTTSIARIFRELGIDLYRTMTVGDNIERIAAAICEAMQRSDIILTTGGLGPTVDDPTRLAVSRAVGVELEFHPELWSQIQERFTRYSRQPSDNNRRQAYIPQGAVALENPVGSAPAFYLDTGNNLIICLPGVPREMDALMRDKVIPLLRNHYKLDQVIKIHVLHCAGVGESQLDEWISEFEYSTNPTVGLLAHAGRVDIRIAAKAVSEQEADELNEALAAQIRERVGDAIYGADSDTLESVLRQSLSARGWSLAAVTCGLQGQLSQALTTTGVPPDSIREITHLDPDDDFRQMVRDFRAECAADTAAGVQYTPGDTRQTLNLFLVTPAGEQENTRTYGGPQEMGLLWGVNSALDFIRRQIQ